MRGFLSDIVANQPRGKEIHVIADNLSAHKTKQVVQFLVDHPTVSSWLIFTSVTDLKPKLMRYIRHYNMQPKPVKWKYIDPTRHTPDSIVTAH